MCRGGVNAPAVRRPATAIDSIAVCIDKGRPRPCRPVSDAAWPGRHASPQARNVHGSFSGDRRCLLFAWTASAGCGRGMVAPVLRAASRGPRTSLSRRRKAEQGMRILVTGGAGFIGTHLCRRLLADGHAVSVVDNEFNGKRENLPPGVWFTLGDVAKPAEVEPAFARGLDAVCHIAGQVSIIRSFTNPVLDLRTNVEGTLNVSQLCLKYKVPRLIYASSMTIYGNGGAVPTPETERCWPDSYYGITKLAGERFVHATAERPDLGFDFKVTSLRM